MRMPGFALEIDKDGQVSAHQGFRLDQPVSGCQQCGEMLR